jgi:Transglycosylase SLT domain
MDGRILVGALLGVIVTAITSTPVYAAGQPEPMITGSVTAAAKATEPPKPRAASNAPTSKSDARSLFKASVRALVEQEVRKTGLPADIADAVVHVESDYNPATIGGVGEIGLMQIRPETAAMLGFKGNTDELAKPETNIHYGVIYLSKAWRLANGDLCRALMKYHAGHGEEVMTPLSVNYCRRARRHLAALGSPFAVGGTVDTGFDPALAIAREIDLPKTDPSKVAAPKGVANSPIEVYAKYRQGTPLASQAFWAAHEARVRAIKARIESKWRRVASR